MKHHTETLPKLFLRARCSQRGRSPSSAEWQCKSNHNSRAEPNETKGHTVSVRAMGRRQCEHKPDVVCTGAQNCSSKRTQSGVVSTEGNGEQGHIGVKRLLAMHSMVRTIWPFAQSMLLASLPFLVVSRLFGFLFCATQNQCTGQ